MKASPFPGMDPWLELHWGDVHHSFMRDAGSYHSSWTLRSRPKMPPGRRRCKTRQEPPEKMTSHWEFVILWSLVIGYWSFFRHWSLGIRHSAQWPWQVNCSEMPKSCGGLETLPLRRLYIRV